MTVLSVSEDGIFKKLDAIVQRGFTDNVRLQTKELDQEVFIECTRRILLLPTYTV